MNPQSTAHVDVSTQYSIQIVVYKPQSIYLLSSCQIAATTWTCDMLSNYECVIFYCLSSQFISRLNIILYIIMIINNNGLRVRSYLWQKGVESFHLRL